MSMNNDERLFMMMATIEQLVEQTKQQQAVITAQSEQISQLGVSTEFGPYRAVSTFVCF